MKKKYLSILLAALSSLLSNFVSAQEFTWYQPNFPPYIIIKGDYQEYGIDNQIIETMIQNLPNSDHHFELANYKRILQNLKQGNTGIITPLFKTPERMKYIHYSKTPSYLVFPNGFIYNKADKDKYIPFFLEDGSIDLEALCRSKQFIIGVNAGRSYYGVLDKIIKRHKNDNHFFVRSAQNHLGVLKMVVQKHIDAALGFPVEIKYSGLEDKLGFLRVANMPSYTPIYFGSSKTSEGIKQIEMLDHILEKKNLFDQFAENYIYWLDENMVEKYNQLRQAYYETCKTKCIDKR